MIRDRIVIGPNDPALSEKLQMDSELTLSKATEAAREREVIKQQQKILRKDFQEETRIDIVSQKSWDRKAIRIQCRKCGKKITRNNTSAQLCMQLAIGVTIKAIIRQYVRH